MKPLLFYDLEQFKNFHSAYFIEETGREYVFVIAPWRNDIKSYLLFLEKVERGSTLVSYYGHGFDDPLLSFFKQFFGFTKEKRYTWKPDRINLLLHHRANALISRSKKPKSRYRSIDAAEALGHRRFNMSLKSWAVNLRHDLIQDLPHPPDHLVQPQEEDEILRYNRNDVIILIKGFNHSKEDFEARELLSDHFHVDLMSASDAHMGEKILTRVYEEITGDRISDLVARQKYPEIVKMSDCIYPFIQFENQDVTKLLEEIRSRYVHISTPNFKYEVSAYGHTFKLGLGGLHSKDKPGLYKPPVGYRFFLADVSSYYPSQVIAQRLKPAHAHERFPDAVASVVEQRMKNKYADPQTPLTKALAYGLKIAANSIVGKAKSKFSWIYDPTMFFTITVSGQLMLLMLAEKLYEHGMEIVSANTDGIDFYVKDSDVSKAEEVMKQWMDMTGLELDIEEYEWVARKDVNNYIAKFTTGDVKSKGALSPRQSMKGGYKYPIVAEAVFKYFVEGIPPEQTIKNCRDILKFCLSQKMGRDFKAFLVGPDTKTRLQKTNRFYVSTGLSTLQKEKDLDKEESDQLTLGLDIELKRKRKNAIIKGHGVTILNNLPERVDMDDVQYDYYISEAKEIIDKIKKVSRDANQLSLF